MNVEINGPKILGYLFGNTNLPITETMRNSWIIMAFILFCLLKAVNKITSLGAKKEEPAAPTTKVCPYCMSEIDIKATRCPHCTSQLPEEENSCK